MQEESEPVTNPQEKPSDVELTATKIETPRVPGKSVSNGNNNNHQDSSKVPVWVYVIVLMAIVGVFAFSIVWKKGIMKKDLRTRLTPLQYHVTQEDGTEVAFDNEYWGKIDPGIYVDIVSGEPLFSSIDKYNAKTGWPSFTKPLEPDNIVFREDSRFIKYRTEVRSKKADSHLGHVFDDGPAPTGKRYSINSAALRFIPAESLKKEGYGKYAPLFEKREIKEIATFAGGCFWCLEEAFEGLKGVLSVTSGYMGGRIANPTSEQIMTGKTGHVETNQVVYNSDAVNYEKLLDVYFKNIDPTDSEGQFDHRGSQYNLIIFYNNERQKELAEKYIINLDKIKIFKKPIVVKVLPASDFYLAEEYHQDYYKKRAVEYDFYKLKSGRDEFLNEMWGGI